jgi:hypothetical protein
MFGQKLETTKLFGTMLYSSSSRSMKTCGRLDQCALKATIFPLNKIIPLSYGNIIFGVGENKKLY